MIADSTLPHDSELCLILSLQGMYIHTAASMLPLKRSSVVVASTLTAKVGVESQPG
jgi:hypothetical protein